MQVCHIFYKSWTPTAINHFFQNQKVKIDHDPSRQPYPAFIAMETTRRHWPGRKIRKKITHLSNIKFSDLGVHRIGVLKKKK